jgi:cysteinyl-tRNA synthetase
MVEKMSKFSRNFISLKTLAQIVNSDNIKKLSRAIRRWSRPIEDSAELRKEIADKDKKLQETEGLFKEYQ